MNLSFVKYTLITFLGILSLNSFSQIVLFEETFEDPTSVNTNWNLNTVNFWIGSNNSGDNQWIVNDQYVGVNIPGIGFIPDTDSSNTANCLTILIVQLFTHSFCFFVSIPWSRKHSLHRLSATTGIVLKRFQLKCLLDVSTIRIDRCDD